MPESPFLVTGATGRQGGAVVRHLLAAGATVRILARDPDSAASRALARGGAEIMGGSFDDQPSLARALAGVRGVFSVQPLLLGKALVEIEWGKRIAGEARNAGVAHFVYSSVFGAQAATNVPHFASKGQIENHIRSIGLPYTILQPAGFMENLFLPVVLKGVAKGKLTLPNDSDAPQHLIAVDDIGALAARVFTNPAGYLGKTIPLVADVLSTRGQAAVLSRVLSREIRPGRLPALIVRLFLGRDLQRMFQWNDRNAAALTFDTDSLRIAHPGLSNFESWCRKHAPVLSEAVH